MGRKSLASERRREIILHFIEVAKDESVESTSIAKVADHMGVNPSLIMHYFKTKDELLIAVSDYIYSEKIEPIFNKPHYNQHDENKIQTLIESQITSALPDDYQNLLLQFFYLSTRKPEVKENLVGGFLNDYTTIKHEFNKLIPDKTTSKYDPEMLTYLLICINLGIRFKWTMGIKIEDEENLNKKIANLFMEIIKDNKR